MADTKISALTAIGALAAGDKVPVADADDLTTTKSATMTDIKTYFDTLALSSANITALPAAGTVAGTDTLPINQTDTAGEVTVNQLKTYIGPTLISGNSGTVNAQAAPSETWQVLTSNAAANATTGMVTVMTSSTLAAGTYWYRYDIIAQSSLATTSLKFAVDATGTVTRHLYRLLWPSAGVTAATGVVDQEAPAVTTGSVYAWQGTRVDNTTLGPQTDVDTINADIHFVIEGMLTTSTSGNLLLTHGSETANSTQVMAGTCLQLKRMA
jgi:hypothetical protein